MSDRHDDPTDPAIERIARALRLAPDIGMGVERRVLAALREADPAAPARHRGWIGVAALAAGLAAILLTGRSRSDPELATPAAVAAAAPVEFTIRAPGSSRVSIVGDFNDWDPGANPLTTRAEGVWATTIPLGPGRYNYAFVVDGVAWVPGDADPRALGEDFGTPTSVVMVPSSI
jgi:hypothetical protein